MFVREIFERPAAGALTTTSQEFGSNASNTPSPPPARSCCLGHRRLWVIDLQTGNQPMESNDGRYVIVFNGEIYNFLELRARLIGDGAVFQTQSDTRSEEHTSELQSLAYL